MIRKIVFGLSAIALSAMAVLPVMRGSSSVSVDAVSYGAVNTSHDYYFDYLRAHDQDAWTLVQQVYVNDYDYTVLAFNTSFSVSNFVYDQSANSSYMFRFCGDDLGNVYLYYLAYPRGAMGIRYLYDFSLSFLTSGDIVFENLAMHSAGSASVAYEVYFPSSGSTVSSLFSNVSRTIYSGTNTGIGPLMQFRGRWSATYNNPNDNYMDGYQDGENAGREEGYDSGVADGRSDGFASGYSDGYQDGDSAGYSDGYGVGVRDGMVMGETTVIDIWPLLSAIITMPFTFFSQEWNATLFAGTPYEFSVSMFVSSILIILMLWKIITMIIGFTAK